MNEGMDTNVSDVIEAYKVIMNCNDYYKVWPEAYLLITYADIVRNGELEDHMQDVIYVGSITMTLYSMINVGLSTFLTVHEYAWKGESMYDTIKKEAIDYFGDNLYYLDHGLSTKDEWIKDARILLENF